MSYGNNEDAGDCRAYMDADYGAHLAEEKAYQASQAYLAAYDSESASMGPVYLGREQGCKYPTALRIDGVPQLLHGPVSRPICEECSKDLDRSEPEGEYSSEWGFFFCTGEHREAYLSSMGHGGGSDYEDFGADNNGPIGDWYYGD